MSPEFEELTERLSKEVAAQLGAVEGRLAARVDHAEEELKRHSKTHMESLREEVKLAAEGYAGTLESIDRRLGRLEKKVDRNHGDNIRILENHNARITRLEETG